MQASYARTIGFLFILAGIAFAAFKVFNQPSETPVAPSAREEFPAEMPEEERGKKSKEKEANDTSFFIRCAVTDARGREKVSFYPADEGCPEEEEELSGGAQEDEQKVAQEEKKEQENVRPQENPAEVREASVLESRHIRITAPLPGAALASPFTVQGEARVSPVYIRIKNTKGKTLILETVPVPGAGDSWAPFSWTIQYEFQATKEGTVEVYSKGAGGEQENMLEIPVSF